MVGRHAFHLAESNLRLRIVMLKLGLSSMLKVPFSVAHMVAISPTHVQARSHDAWWLVEHLLLVCRFMKFGGKKITHKKRLVVNSL